MSHTRPDDTERRYCPRCGKGVNGRPHQFVEEVICPRCKKRVWLFEYPTSPPTYPPESQNKDNLTFKLLACSVGMAVLLILVCLLLIIAGQGMSAALLAVVLLVIGVVLIIVAVERHSKVTDLSTKVAHYELAKQCLKDGIEKWNGLESSIQSIKRDQGRKLDEAFNQKMMEMSLLELDLNKRIEETSEHRDAVQTVAEKYVKDLVTFVMKNVTSNNFATSKEKIEKAIEYCRKKGAIVTEQAEKEIYSDLRDRFEDIVRKEAARDEQRRIKERIREEQKAQAEIDRELQRLLNEQAAIQAAIQNALARTNDEHSAEVEMLKQQLRDAEERSQRALSMAQQTKAGNVYVISNIGSFGDDVFKIGMTRRVEPMDRIRELGDASVPFGFDVHMMISCNDAPSLENTLHRQFHSRRLNKVDNRKEFFRVSVEEIRELVEQHHGKVDYVATPDALEYRESQKLYGEDLEFVERVLDRYQPDDEG